jgi:hypothetical protein
MLAPIFAEAMQRWSNVGISPDQMTLLNSVTATISDLPAGILAGTTGSSIAIDVNAAGWGWFVDSTPADNLEFGTTHSATELTATSGDAFGHIDLLTTVMHELGHVLGFEHSAVPGDLMDEAVALGIRRLPSAAELAAASTGETAVESGVGPVNQIAGAAAHNIAGGFDAQYYLAHNPDVAAAGVDPLLHFDTFGWHEGRNPNAYFDTAGYLAHYADVAAAGVNPLQPYEEFGWKEGRDPSASFDTLKYLAANPDVAAAHVNPLEHYLIFGVHEGRAAINDGLWH